jgi:hypothetical protein
MEKKERKKERRKEKGEQTKRRRPHAQNTPLTALCLFPSFCRGLVNKRF